MSSGAQGLIPVVQRSYDLCAGLYEHVKRFPRAERGLLGRVILEDALRMLVGLTAANRRKEKAAALMEAGGHLDALRITLRLGKQLGYVSNGGYEKLSGVADEVGRMLGGWIKHEGRPAPERAVAVEPPALRAPVARRERTGGVRYTMTSPTIEKYLRTKREHPQAVVFVTVGAFCQSFFEDAKLCRQVLRVAVRNVAAESEAQEIPTCGIPRSRMGRYAVLLRRAGREVHVARTTTSGSAARASRPGSEGRERGPDRLVRDAFTEAPPMPAG